MDDSLIYASSCEDILMVNAFIVNSRLYSYALLRTFNEFPPGTV